MTALDTRQSADNDERVALATRGDSRFTSGRALGNTDCRAPHTEIRPAAARRPRLSETTVRWPASGPPKQHPEVLDRPCAGC